MFDKNTTALLRLCPSCFVLHPEWRRAQLFFGGFTCINNCVVATRGSSGHQRSPIFSNAQGVKPGKLDLYSLIR